MIDVWNYKDNMKEYVIDKYGFNIVKCAKNVDDNLLILLCYFEEPGKIYRHAFTVEEIDKILELRKCKLQRIFNDI